MISKAIKSTQLFNEIDGKVFDCKSKKYLHDIDNVYFSVTLKDDDGEHYQVDKMLEHLKGIKEKVKEDKKDKMIGDNFYLTAKSFSIYSICLNRPDEFDIFIGEYLPNDKTPRILVQLRSKPLWLKGYRKAISEVMGVLSTFLSYYYEIEVQSTKETRIDYAFHTNYIQNHMRYFSDSYMKSKLNFSGQYMKVGNFTKSKGETSMSIDYLSLGSRKSNNVFFRTYNKSREVIEKGYKAWFIEIWHENKMISDFDKWCMEYAYRKKSYASLHEARLKYYIEFGHDLEIKLEFHKLIENRATYKEMEYACKGIVPNVTLISNIEFETKRKFYRTCDAFLNPLMHHDQYRIITILDNRHFFLDYLTSEFIWFGKSTEVKKYDDWWSRLRKLKLNDSEPLSRNYDNDIDSSRIFKGLLNKLASVATLKEDNSTDILEDIQNFMDNINDNHKSDYIDLKEKKHKYYANKLPKPLNSEK